MIPTLRPCQDDLIDAIGAKYLEKHRRVLAVASTGFGKTIVFCALAARAMKKGKRVVIVAHRMEIIDQISRALDSFGVKHGRIQAGHTMTDDPIQVCMVITLAKRIDKVREPDLLIVDEAHHAVAASWAAVASAWTKSRILGVTATPIRADGRGLGEAFDAMVEAIPMSELIAQGYLSKYTYLAPPTQVDLSHVKTRMGDFAIDQLADAVDKAVITGDAVQHYKNYLDGRPAIAFAVTVQHAEHIAEQFRAAGYRAASVDGKMEKAERRDRIAAIGDGRLNVLTSCDIISEGTDIPVVSGALLLRPTKSVGLFLQQVGRVLRPKPDGSAAVILDHVGNIRMGMPDAPRQWSLDASKKNIDQPGASTCKKCFRAFSSFPGWKAKAECNEGQPDGCVLNPTEIDAALGKSAPEIVAGELKIVTNTPSWADGFNIATVKGSDFAEVIAKADTIEKMKEIAKSRGYHWRWAIHQMANRQGREQAA